MALARRDGPTSSKGSVPTGFADEVVISDTTFRQQHLSYERNNGPPAKKRKREDRGDSAVVFGAGAYKGPWARYAEARPDVRPEDADDVDAESVEEVEEVSEFEEDALPSHSLVKPSKAGTSYGEDRLAGESTTFYGQEEHDYQGRTYMHIPQDLSIDLRGELPPYNERKNFFPKRLIRSWKSKEGNGKAHSRSVNQLRFFPSSGHLLLSASADGNVLLWDVYRNNRSLLRGYYGSGKSASDIDFTPSGENFISASFDRKIRLWDTETGACVSRFDLGATPHVARVNVDKPSEFLVGQSNNVITQWDTRADDKKAVQEYNHHLGPVNTLEWCDNYQRFMSTSDDRSIRAWEYGIPVPIKNIHEPDMYPLVRSTKHPSDKYVAYQSSSNDIQVYSCSDKFRQNRKKGFRGHNTAGYAVDCQISPDGGMVASGDSAGLLCVFDWRTCKLLHKVEASKEGAVVSLAWHPRESSRIVTGSTSGELRYWD